MGEGGWGGVYDMTHIYICHRLDVFDHGRPNQHCRRTLGFALPRFYHEGPLLPGARSEKAAGHQAEARFPHVFGFSHGLIYVRGPLSIRDRWARCGYGTRGRLGWKNVQSAPLRGLSLGLFG